MHYGLITLLFIKLIIELSKQNECIPINKLDTLSKPKNIFFGKTIQYISNGKLLDDSHTYYYINMLNLFGVKNIDNHTIMTASENRRALINKNNTENPIVSTRDIAAAKFFLLDQCTYCTSYN